MEANELRTDTENRGRKTSGYVFKRGRKWWACWTHNGTKYRVSTEKTKRDEAEKVLAEKISPFFQREKADVLASLQARLQKEQDSLAAALAKENRILISDVWARFPYDYTSPRRGTRRRLSPRNVEENRGAWNRFVAYMAKNHPDTKHLEDVTPRHAKSYSEYLINSEKLTAGRHNKLITTVKVMFTLADRPHPFTIVPRYEVAHESRKHLEPDQLQKVCSKAQGELRRLFVIMFYTGLRLGDAALLKWEDIQHDVIHRMMAKTHKTVSFPVHDELKGVLEEVSVADRHGFVCKEIAAQYQHKHQSVSNMIRRHFEACGIDCVEGRDSGSMGISRYGAHSFRHTFVTMCARGGVPQGLVRQWVGHASVNVTRIYEHWSPDQEKQRILAALPAVMSVVQSPPSVLRPEDSVAQGAALAKVRDLLPKMTAKNWRQIQTEIGIAIGLSLSA